MAVPACRGTPRSPSGRSGSAPGEPLAIRPPKSSTCTVSHTPSTTDMSWSTSSTVTPRPGSVRRTSASSAVSWVSSPAAGSSSRTRRGSGHQRPGERDQVPLTVGELVGPSVRRRGRARAPPAPASTRPVSLGRDRNRSARNDPRLGGSAATSRFSRTVRSSKSSRDWNVRTSPRRARSCGASWSIASPSSWIRPDVAGVKPLRVSMNVVLPGTVRADQPGDLSARDLDAERRASASSPPWCTVRLDTSRHGRSERHASDAASTVAAGGPTTALDRPVRQTGQTVGGEDGREDQRDAAGGEDVLPDVAAGQVGAERW